MKWLTTREACDYLKIGKSTLMSLRADGRVKAYPLYRGKGKVRPILRWLESDLDALLLGQKRQRMGRTTDAKQMREEIVVCKALGDSQ